MEQENKFIKDINGQREILLLPEERVDDLNRKGFRIIQHPHLFCFGMDAVLLTGFAKIKKGERVLDLGTGTGVIPILLAAKSEEATFEALEIQPESADMARRSVQLNALDGRVQIIDGDIKEADVVLKKASYDVITSNPPYMPHSDGLKNERRQLTIARHEMLCTLEDVIRVAAKLLRVGGRFYMVHRPHRLVDIMTLLRQYELEPKVMQLVHPFSDKEPNMVLIEAVRKGKVELKTLKPLIIYAAPQCYTEDVRRLYED